jgi:4-amino-4-deoxy-L-arabinose transferase-like glycosyltransferase
MAIGFLPWSFFLVPAIVDAVKRIRRRDPWMIGYVLAACWIGVYVAVFSLARTKLPNYVAPAYPALALLTGCYLHHLVRSSTLSAAWWPYAAMGMAAAFGAALLVALPLLASTSLPGEEWLGVLGVLPLLSAIVCIWLYRQGRTAVATSVFAVFSVLFATVVLGGVAMKVDRHQQVHVLLEAIDSRSDRPQVAAYGAFEPSWVFYGGRPIQFIRRRHPDRAVEFLGNRVGSDRFVITTRENFARISARLPANTGVLETVPYFMKPTQLLLLGAKEN